MNPSIAFQILYGSNIERQSTVYRSDHLVKILNLIRCQISFYLKSASGWLVSKISKYSLQGGK